MVMAQLGTYGYRMIQLIWRPDVVDVAFSFTTRLYVTRIRWQKTRKKPFAGTSRLKATNALKAFAHGLDPQRDQRFGVFRVRRNENYARLRPPHGGGTRWKVSETIFRSSSWAITARAAAARA